MSTLCRIGLHSWPHWIVAYTQAPEPIRCYRCGKAKK